MVPVPEPVTEPGTGFGTGSGTGTRFHWWFQYWFRYRCEIQFRSGPNWYRLVQIGIVFGNAVDMILISTLYILPHFL